MQRICRLLLASIVLLPVVLIAERTAVTTALLSPIPMPLDRSADSYLIYSGLMPLGETAGQGWPHDLWLVQDVTISVVPPGQPCWVDAKLSKSAGFVLGMNPHIAVHPPDDQMQDYKEIMEDFDRHCHERLTLDPDAWKTSVPVHLLTPAEQVEFQSKRFTNSDEAAKYKGAPALYGFSEVYFNTFHTAALVYATHWCGGLCGEGFWVALRLENGQWKQLRWNATRWISWNDVADKGVEPKPSPS